MELLKAHFKKIDPLLFMASSFILALGVLTIFTSTYSAEDGISAVATSQAVFAIIGVGLYLVASRVNYRFFRTFSVVFYLVVLGLLVLVLIAGKSVYGSTSWLPIGSFQFQPAELAKLALILALGRYFSTKTGRLSFGEILISFVFVVPYILLVLLQPDFGTAMVIGVIWLVMMLAARPRLPHVAALGIPVIIALPFLWQQLKGYQKSRILVFVNSLLGRPMPESDSLGAAYNVLQSQIAVGAGRIFGRGIGQGTQGNLNFLPIQSQQTDFIFAIFTEQLGFIGAGVLLLLLTLVVFRIARAAKFARDGFGMYVAVGTFGMIAFHILVNIGMNMGIMPVTGIPLPLFSYGGTALIVTCVTLGMVQSVYRFRKGLEFSG